MDIKNLPFIGLESIKWNQPIQEYLIKCIFNDGFIMTRNQINNQYLFIFGITKADYNNTTYTYDKFLITRGNEQSIQNLEFKFYQKYPLIISRETNIFDNPIITIIKYLLKSEHNTISKTKEQINRMNLFFELGLVCEWKQLKDIDDIMIIVNKFLK
jgi:hypothetical protein